jgi:hypothetical protein
MFMLMLLLSLIIASISFARFILDIFPIPDAILDVERLRPSRAYSNISMLGNSVTVHPACGIVSVALGRKCPEQRGHPASRGRHNRDARVRDV